MRVIHRGVLATATTIALVGGSALGLSGAAAAFAASPATPVSTATNQTATAIVVSAAAAVPNTLGGTDVSYVQGSVDWASVSANGGRFAYVKATQGIAPSNVSSVFATQYSGAAAAGLVRGAYHYADPLASNGTVQANWFVQHGGGWSPDSKTLPPMLDVENSQSKGDCYGLSTSAIVTWISDFSTTILSRTGTRPVIYTTPAWWKECTGNSTAFTSNPLFINVRTTAQTPGALPGGWKNWSLWQHAVTGTFPGDQDYFNGNAAALTALAFGGKSASTVLPDTTTATNSLSGVSTLAPGASLVSNSGQYRLTMQTDGNLVLFGNGRPLWSTATSGKAGASLSLQSDGNAVLYSTAHAALWNSGTSFLGTSPQLTLGNDGDLVLRSAASGAVAWRLKAPGSDTLSAGGSLTAGQYLHSASGTNQLVMQTDGNLVVYLNGTAKWSSKTSGQSGVHLDLQTDGNLVLYNAAGRPLWFTNTSGKGAGGRVTMQADGNLVLYSGAGKALWFTSTKA